MKYKMLIIISFLIVLVLGSGVTYSMFFSDSDLNIEDQQIASFIFDAKKTSHLNIDLIGLKPGDNEDYTFSVSNNSSNKISNVTFNYQITVQTYHFIPLKIELYKVNNTGENLILDCNETFSRNDKNVLVCNSPVEEMSFSTSSSDDYKMKVSFPSEYNSTDYVDLVDFISLDIKSWQKVRG